MAEEAKEEHIRLKIRGHEIVLHYYRRGTGNRFLLTFHGFGQSARDMFPLEDPDHFTTIHFDIFYHGQSFWTDSLGPLRPVIWKEILESFLEIEGIDRFSLMGFSMGGKFVFASLHALPGRVDSIILLAPDGVKTSTWYSLANYPLIIKPYFRSMIVKPWRFYSLISVVERAGLLDKGLSKFAALHMDTRKKRRRVYYSWIMFKPLSFSMKQTGSIINKYQIDLTIYVGEFDKIITAKAMDKLLKYVDKARLVKTESGHNQLISKVASLRRQKNF